MPRRQSKFSIASSTAAFWLLAAFLLLLWIAGGASRSDVAAQAVVRFGAWTILVGIVLTGSLRDLRRVRAVGLLLALSIALLLAQLLPLPPGVWADLPGRRLFSEAALASQQVQPWRPISISPDGTTNALGSLVVPLATLFLMAKVDKASHWRLAGWLLALIFAGAVLGLLQFSGAHFDNPLFNDVAGQVSANFANRNHFAVFVAIGCILAPSWALRRSGQSRVMIVLGLALLPLFAMIILTTGSRMGAVVGAVAIALGLRIARRRLSDELARFPRKLALPIVAGFAAALLAAIGLSIFMNRAVSLDRAFDIEVGEDLRSRTFPVLIDMIGQYFPIGSGFGTFDPVYRISEPDALLSPYYFNHAHNDWLEIALEGGVFGIALLTGALAWWILASVRAWRDNGRGSRSGSSLARVGSAIIALLIIASATDYPLRTPMMMALLTIAAAWLGWSDEAAEHASERGDAGSAVPWPAKAHAIP